MKFQKKIIIIYAIFAIITTGVIGGVYYSLSVKQIEAAAYAELKTISDIKLQQFENMLSDMESVSVSLLSDQNVLEAIDQLAKMKKSAVYSETYFHEAVSTIRLKLNTYYFMDSFYRIIFFNQQDVVVANNNYAGNSVGLQSGYASYEWKERVVNTQGKNILIEMHEDNWGGTSGSMVFSSVKEIQGNQRGFIEVQMSQEDLNALFRDQISQDGQDYFFFNSEGILLYTTKENVNIEPYTKALSAKDEEVMRMKIEDGSEEIFVRERSEKSNITILTVSYSHIEKQAILEVLPFTLVLIIGFVLLSFGYIIMTSKQLTRPIKMLQKYMEETELNNLNIHIPEKISNDEIGALYLAYKDVLQRLDESIVKEKRLSMLQLQAQFDLLQAQINPHFIYNVLNVISNRGIISDDEVICDICSDLAQMLRYATNTKEKYAKIKNEFEYLEWYLALLKYRYGSKLTYTIKTEKEAEHYILPKISLQQIVENCIAHGYEYSSEDIQVDICVYQTSLEWRIEILDAGIGISEERKNNIYEEIERIKRKLTKNRNNVELEIGGMGLVNTFARLYLLYNEDLIFEIDNGREKGTKVIIGAKKGDANNV